MITYPNQTISVDLTPLSERNIRLIAFAAPKQSGKTTAASYLEMEFGAQIFPFAEPVKAAIVSMLGGRVPTIYTQAKKEEPLPGRTFSWRQACEWLGNDARRALGEDVWIDSMRIKIQETAGLIVIDDLRYANEAAMVRELGGLVVGIRRPFSWRDNAPDISEIEQCAHEVVKHHADLIIHNSQSLLLDNAFVDDVLALGKACFGGGIHE